MGNRSTGAIRRSIANQKGVIDGINARITSLSGRIERLETARDSVDGIYQDTCTMVDNMAAYDVGIAWQGNLREDWEDLRAMPLRRARPTATRSTISIWRLTPR